MADFPHGFPRVSLVAGRYRQRAGASRPGRECGPRRRIAPACNFASARRRDRRAGMQKGTMRWDDLRVFLAVARHGQAAGGGADAGARPDHGRAADRRARGGARGPALRPLARGLCADRGGARADGARPGDGERRRARRPRRSGGQPDRLSGTVRIGAPDGVSNYLLVDACDALSRDNPDLQVQVVALPRMFSLSKREADLAITVSPPTAGRLTVRKIADYRLAALRAGGSRRVARAGADDGGSARGCAASATSRT